MKNLAQGEVFHMRMEVGPKSSFRPHNQYSVFINIKSTKVFHRLAERVGFEPTGGLPRTAFQAVPLGHSGTSPTGILYNKQPNFKSPSMRGFYY